MEYLWFQKYPSFPGTDVNEPCTDHACRMGLWESENCEGPADAVTIDVGRLHYSRTSSVANSRQAGANSELGKCFIQMDHGQPWARSFGWECGERFSHEWHSVFDGSKEWKMAEMSESYQD